MTDPDRRTRNRSWLPLSSFPVANAGRSYLSSDGLDGRWQQKRHETVWRAVASCKRCIDPKRQLTGQLLNLPGASSLQRQALRSTRRFQPAELLRRCHAKQ